jgi:hypothetical protein
MKILKCLFQLILVFIASYFVIQTGKNLDYLKQVKFLDDIRTISSIIFGVSGAWLALTYPKALLSADLARKAESNNAVLFEQAKHDNKVLLSFIHTMLISTIIIGVSLIIPFVKEVLSSYLLLHPYKACFRSILFYFLAIMSFTQLLLLIQTLKESKRALKELRGSIAQAQTRAQRNQNNNH